MSGFTTEIDGEPGTDSLDVLVGTRFSSGRAGPVISAVQNNHQYWVRDSKGYGHKPQHIMFQS